VPARISAGNGPDEVRADFGVPQRAVTPGQSAVFYGGEGENAGQVVIGGGIIREAVRKAS
jgi:tRNA-specific 2-thiouridylase